MNRWNFLSTASALLAWCGMLLPASRVVARQGEAVSSSGRITDVALDSAGALHGRVVDDQGQGVPGVPVQLKRGELSVVSTQTDEAGCFQVRSLSGGVYELLSGAHRAHVRIWAPHTAPPGATQGLTVVAGAVKRGQTSCTTESCTGTCDGTCGAACGPCGGPLAFLTHPLVIGAAVAAAIAIPIAVSNDDDDDAS